MGTASQNANRRIFISVNWPDSSHTVRGLVKTLGLKRSERVGARRASALQATGDEGPDRLPVRVNGQRPVSGRC